LDCSEFSSGDSLIASPHAKRMRFKGQLYEDHSDEESDDGNAELNDYSTKWFVTPLRHTLQIN